MVRELLAELADLPGECEECEVWAGVRCDIIGAAKSAFKGWPVLGAVLFEGDNCVHVVG
jgi:hypothetical protein